MNEQSIMVIIAALVNFFLGGLWYSLFKKRWLVAWGFNADDINPKDPVPYLVAFIGSLWSSYGLFLILKHIQPKNYAEMLAVAIGIWLFIFVGMGAKHYAFAKRSLNAFLIDYGLDFVGLIIMSFILWKNY